MSRIEDAILKVKAQNLANAQASAQASAEASAQAGGQPGGPVGTPAGAAPVGQGRVPPGPPTLPAEARAEPPSVGQPTAATAATPSTSGTWRMPPPDLLSTTAMYASVVANPKRPVRTVPIDTQALVRAGLLPPKEDARQISNEFRAIKRTLLGNVTGRHGPRIDGGNVMMVASAVAGEGKTYCAVNLALTLSLEKDYSVVLIDGDVAKPNVSRVLGLEESPGLLDLLRSGEGDLASIEIGTSIPRLSVVPAGRLDEDAAELLSSNRMVRLVAEMHAQPHRLYVFDSTPLLLTNESRVLAEVAGQILLVVQAAATPRAAVKSALAELPENAYIGVVLNQKEAAPGADYYGYGHYGHVPKGEP